MTAIVIMNGNLRVRDNPALHAACSEGSVIPVYLLELHSRSLGSNQVWWLSESLKNLSKSVKLVVRKGDPATAIKALLKESKAESVYWNDPIDQGERRFYNAIERAAVSMGADVAVGEGNVLVDPETMSTGGGGFFKVFTPFWTKCLRVLDPSKPLPAPRIRIGKALRSDPIPKVSHETLGVYWSPGEAGAQKNFKAFCSTKLAKYGTQRDLVGFDGTSRLSPHLRWGEISVREIYHTIKKSSSSGAKVFLSEIGFREFSYYLLHHFPKLGKENFRSEFNRFPWSSSASHMRKWTNGETGYPIVDAAMQQLHEMGWMHNRARMIVGSFLTKDLLIDWRKGEKVFWDLLVDGDPALNAFNWQWVAGCGVDAAPFFRIFNPTTQEKKFDPHGDYVSTWLDDEEIEPIVDHDEARKKALAIHKKL